MAHGSMAGGPVRRALASEAAAGGGGGRQAASGRSLRRALAAGGWLWAAADGLLSMRLSPSQTLQNLCRGKNVENGLVPRETLRSFMRTLNQEWNERHAAATHLPMAFYRRELLLLFFMVLFSHRHPRDSAETL